MPGTGIWLSDNDLSQTAGAIWSQQQVQQVTQKAQAGQQWAADQIARLQQQAQAQVQQFTAPPPAPAAPAPPPVAPPTPVAPVAAAPVPAPEPAPVAPAPADTVPTPAPAPTPPPPAMTPTPGPTDISPAGQNWAQQQIQNLLNPAQNAPQPSSSVPTLTPTSVGLNASVGAPDTSSTGLSASTPTPTPTPTSTPDVQSTPASAGAAGGGPALGPIDSSSPQAFAQSIAPYAQAAAQKLGIDPKWVAAMAASESNYGKAAGNELFGIKALPGQPGTSMQTHEGEYGGTTQNATFASYDTPMDAVNAFVNLIQNHYPGAIGAQDLGTFVHGLKQGGYFTAAEPEYAGILQGIQGHIGDAVDAALQGGQQVASAAQNVAQQGQTAVNNVVQGAQAIVARTSQFAMGLSSGDAMAFCGPAAAMAFAQQYGRNPTVDEAKQLALQVGWNPSQGMAGVGSEVTLLNAMGIDAHATSGVDWGNVAQSASSGNPVIIDTPGHYFYVDGYNADTGQFHLGSSATDLKAAKGQEWFTPDQIPSLGMGDPRAAVFADHPLSQSSPTPAGSGQSLTMGANQPAGAASSGTRGDDLLTQLLNEGGNAASAIGSGFSALGSGASSLLNQGLRLPGDIQTQAQNVQSAVLNVGGTASATGQNLLTNAQSALSGVPQTASDLLNLNGLGQAKDQATAALLNNVLDPLSQANTENQQWLLQHPDIAAIGGLTTQPIDPNQPLGPQLTGFDPYKSIVQQGLPSILSGLQTGNVGDVLGGGLQTLLGAASVLPGTGGEASAARALTPTVAEALLKPGEVPWSNVSRDLLQQGPLTQQATPAILRAIDDAAQARALGVSPDLLTGQFDDLGRRIPAGMLENPLTSADLGRASYDQYGVFQREPSLYSDRGIAMDPSTGQEIVPPESGALDWRTPMDSSSVLEGLQQMARERGLDPTAPLLSQRLADLTDQVTSSFGSPLRNFLTGEGSESGAINLALMRALGGGAAGGLGAYETTDPNDPNRALKIAGAAGLSALAGGPGVELALHGSPSGIPASDWLRGLYRGGLIAAPSTMLDVAGTSTLMPVVQTLSGLGRDLATLQPGRAAARLQGTLTGLQQWVPTFLNALSAAHANPGSLVARAGTLPEQIAAYGAEGAGMLHGAFQDATQNLIRQQELATGASAAQAAGTGARAAAGQELGTVTSWLGRAATGGGPITDALFPIYRKGMQLASRMVEFSPLGAAGSAIDVARGLAGQGPYAAGLGSTPVSNAVGPLSERLVNNAIGTGLSILLAHQALEGNITGSWEGLTPAQQDTLRAQGQMPDGFQIGGAWHSWDKLPPALRGPFMAAGAYADAQHAYDAAQAKQGSSGPQAYGVEDPREAAAVALMREVGGQLINQTPLKTFSNTYDAVTGGGGAGALYNAPVDMISNVLGGLVPESAIVRTAAQAGDPNQRQVLQPKTLNEVLPAILQNVQQNIPGVREQLPTRVDVLGRDVANPQQGLASVLPLRAAAGQPSPILQAMSAAGVAPSSAPPSIPYGPNAQINLRPDEQQQYDRYRGQLIQQMAGDLVKSPQFQQMPDFAQQRVLATISQRAGEVASRMMLGDLAPNARNRLSTTGVLAPVISYGPSPLDQMQQMRNHAAHQALIQALLSQ